MTYASFPSGEALWESLLLLMLVSAVTAFFLQLLLRRRSWCSQLCPFGRVLDSAVKARRIAIPTRPALKKSR
jgi:polyferredoxin